MSVEFEQGDVEAWFALQEAVVVVAHHVPVLGVPDHLHSQVRLGGVLLQLLKKMNKQHS